MAGLYVKTRSGFKRWEVPFAAEEELPRVLDSLLLEHVKDTGEYPGAFLIPCEAFLNLNYLVTCQDWKHLPYFSVQRGDNGKTIFFQDIQVLPHTSNTFEYSPAPDTMGRFIFNESKLPKEEKPYVWGESSIHGHGLFASRNIERGELLINWMKDAKIISEAEYLKNKEEHALTGVRLIGDKFITGEVDDTDYINHSDDPNLLYFMGLVFAKRDIYGGAELTLDYRYLCSAEEVDVVQGFSAEVSLDALYPWVFDWIVRRKRGENL